MAKGLYQEWIDGKGLETVCKWAKLGMTDSQIADQIGIGRRTFYTWQERFPQFRNAVREAKAIPNLEIETSMIDLACGKAFIEEIRTTLDPKTGAVTKVEKVRKQIPPNATMLIFLAKNRMKDKYKDYCPVANEQVEENAQTDVQIYLPDNGGDENDS